MEKNISNATRQEIPSSGYKLESENGISVLGRLQVCRPAMLCSEFKARLDWSLQSG